MDAPRFRTAALSLCLLTLAPALGARTHQQAAAPPQILSNQDVIALAKAGETDDAILAKIAAAAGTNFDVSPEALLALKTARVGDDVIAAMMTEPTRKPTAAAAETLAKATA